MKAGFVWYELMTKGDVDAAAKFYADVVGWDVKDSGMPGMKYLLFGNNGRDVGGMMSWQSMKMDLPTTWKAHIYTPDVDAETAAVEKDGGRIHRQPQDIPSVGRFSVVADPQGAEFLLFQPLPHGDWKPLDPGVLGGVGWHELMTTDLDKAWEFYAKHFGWEKAQAVDMGEMGVYQTFRMDRDQPQGGMMKRPPFLQNMPPGWLFYFTVADVDAAVKTIEAGGGKVTHGPVDVPGGGRIVQATDPQGGGFALVSGR